MNEKLKRLFTPDPMVSFRSSGKKSSDLVRAKLYPVVAKLYPPITRVVSYTLLLAV